MSNPGEFQPPQHEQPALASLTETLHEVGLFFGDVRSFSSTSLSLDGTNLRDVLPNIPDDATHLEMTAYQRYDYSIYAKQIEQAGLTVSFAERDRYYPGMDIEPIRFGISVTNEKGSIFADFSVPPDYGQVSEETNGQNAAPTVKVEVSDGARIEDVLATAKLRLQASVLDPEKPFNNDKAGQLATCLSYFQGMIREAGSNQGKRRLTEDATRHLEEWVNLYFYNAKPISDPSTFRQQEVGPHPNLKHGGRIPKFRGVHYPEKRLPEPRVIDRLGSYTKETDYVRGAIIDTELERGARAVSMVIDDDDGTTIEVTIASAHHEGRPIPHAGLVGDYVMRIDRVGSDGDRHVRPVYRYLDASETHIAVGPGEEFVLPENLARDRSHRGGGLRVSGVIKSVVSYR